MILKFQLRLVFNENIEMRLIKITLNHSINIISFNNFLVFLLFTTKAADFLRISYLRPMTVFAIRGPSFQQKHEVSGSCKV